MPEYQIFGDSKGLGNCRSCGQPCWWAEAVDGRRLAIDGEPVAFSASVDGASGRPVETLDTEANPLHAQGCPGS